MIFRALLLFSLAISSVSACYWDRDTLAQESKGLPGILELASGRVERFPPLYYEMRVERLQPLLNTTDNPTLFDDVAVAG